MSYRHYYISVSGSILAKEGKNYTQGWTAGAVGNGTIDLVSNPVYNEGSHSITGDVIFDKWYRAVPYAFYVAYGSIGVQNGAKKGTDLSCCPGFFPAFAYFHEYITELCASLDVKVDERIKTLYFNGLYISAFSVLELFLCDFLLCGVFSNKDYYLRALSKLGVTDEPDQFVVEGKIKNVVYRKVFHAFREIEQLFSAIFDFSFPDYQELQNKIHKRHNIVHRYALSNQDRMTVCDASYDDVRSLIRTIELFVENMKDLCGLSINEREALL